VVSVENSLPKIITIVGPTASGKTDLAAKIAKKYDGEIISADSRQIYRGMDIGTAKPPRDKNPHYSLLNTHYYSEGIPHHLINIKNPNQSYTVAQYKKDAIRVIKKILADGKLPILVGGTGLYIKAVVENLIIPEVKPNPRLRKKLEQKLQKNGLESLYRELVERDPEAAYIVDRHNPRRVIRALEITLATNMPFSVQRKQGQKLFDALKIGLNPPKEKLKSKIEKRVDLMLRAGLLKETKQLMKKYGPNLPAFDAIGYREIINYLQGKISLPETVDLIKKNTWHYAKRQLTWFKKDKEIKWIGKPEEAGKLLRVFLEKGG
jgi:tRNA dimethylallyltransferase